MVFNRSLSVFPNPTSGVINLNIPTYIKLVKLTLIDSKAQHKQIEAIQNGEQWISNLRDVDDGLYILIIDTEIGKYSTKVFVNSSIVKD